MQLTKFDRWLKERFIYETHIFTMRLPEDPLPRGVKVDELDENEHGAHRYMLTIASNATAERVIDQLKENHLMHKTHLVEGRHWYNAFIAPQGKSFTYRWIIRVIGVLMLASFFWSIYTLMQNQDWMKTIKETIKDFK